MAIKNILVCMQHNLTPAQRVELGTENNVILLKDVNLELFAAMANSPGNEEEVLAIANGFVDFLAKEKFNFVVLPLGSPAMMFAVAREIGDRKGFEDGESMTNPRVFRGTALFAHSERKSIEETLPDGSVKKSVIFDHIRFIRL